MAYRYDVRIYELLMLIYLDANIVQYIADHENFVFGEAIVPQTKSGLLYKELEALRSLIEFELEIEQLEDANMWHVAASAHLMKELHAGKPTITQQQVYSTLLRTWADSDWQEHIKSSEEQVRIIDESLRVLNLKQDADRRHLAEAITLEASWFLTNDKDIIKKTRLENNKVGVIQGVRVARPSECLRIMIVNASLGWSENNC
ncbi:MAG TPA: hypothetical protein VGW12_22055 [Pyrinomonadaceae bacterium]|nr:hypothetical protein [Pyrinomonadaceae bacterium]